jgi:Cu2+-exporting ATPase
MSDAGVSVPETAETILTQFQSAAQTIVFFAADKTLLALVAISDQVKTGSAAAVKQLQNIGVEVMMVTGDNKHTAAAIATQTGIQQVKAEALPADKADIIKSFQNQGKTVAMVGDGINDAYALAQADISIAMGKGSDIAMDVAKMTIISSDLLLIPQAIRLSRQTMATIKQNLFWAFFYNIIAIPVAAGALYPIWGFSLNPMIASAAMAFSSISVVSNSLRLKWLS